MPHPGAQVLRPAATPVIFIPELLFIQQNHDRCFMIIISTLMNTANGCLRVGRTAEVFKVPTSGKVSGEYVEQVRAKGPTQCNSIIWFPCEQRLPLLLELLLISILLKVPSQKLLIKTHML